MKYISLIFMALLFAGCNKYSTDVEFTGTAAGVSSGTIVIKNISGNAIYGTPINSGKFHISKRLLEHAGYYTLVFALDGVSPNEFDIYLEPGLYNIDFNKDKRGNYPRITSTSKIQNELSAYYVLNDETSSKIHQQIKAAKVQLDNPKSKQLPAAAYNKLIANLSSAQNQEIKLGTMVLEAFVDKYPDNKIAPFIMAKMDYESNPEVFYRIYQKFNVTAKNTDDGKEIGGKLSHLVKLFPGAVAPGIAGLTPDGKPVDIKAMNKKLVLVEFWRATNELSRLNHQAMILNPIPELGGALGMVSVSFDTKRDWWLAAIKDDKLTWTQVSDLKGDDSPNVINWSISSLPIYYLLDGNGRIIERDIPFNNLGFTVSSHLKKHP